MIATLTIQTVNDGAVVELVELRDGEEVSRTDTVAPNMVRFITSENAVSILITRQPVPETEPEPEPEPEPSVEPAVEPHPRDPDTGQFVAREGT